MDNGRADWLYIAACLLVPGVWGIVSAWIFGKIDERRRAKKPPDDSSWTPPVDYSI